MQENGKLEILTDGLETYLETNAELLKLEATEQTVSVGSGLISSLLIAMIGAWVVLFASLGAAFSLSTYFRNNYSGFVVVAGFYFLLLLVCWVGRKKFIQIPLRDLMVRELFDTKIK